MSQCHAKIMEAIEVLTDFMEQFGFKLTFIFFHKIKIDPDVSENGHAVALELRIHKGAWKTCPGKIKNKIMFKTYWMLFLLRLHNILNAKEFEILKNK